MGDTEKIVSDWDRKLARSQAKEIIKYLPKITMRGQTVEDRINHAFDVWSFCTADGPGDYAGICSLKEETCEQMKNLLNTSKKSYAKYVAPERTNIKHPVHQSYNRK